MGESGSVLGVDRSAESLALARRRAHASGFRNVEFAQASLEALALPGTFDALVGRLILLYLPEPAAVLRQLLGLVRPGGLLVFQEMDMPAARAVPFAAFLQAEVAAGGGVVHTPSYVGAWVKKPG